MELEREFKKETKLHMTWRRLKKSKTAMAGLIILTVIILLAIFANVIGDYNEVAIKMDIPHRLEKPLVNGHLFGTDHYGRDVFVRIAHGARVSVIIGFGAVVLPEGGLEPGVGQSVGFHGGADDLAVADDHGGGIGVLAF